MGTDPPPWDERDKDDYGPFESRVDFEFAEFLYKSEEMAGENIDFLMQLLAARYVEADPPFANHDTLYSLIDSIPLGDLPFESFSVQYTGPKPVPKVPEWMTQKYEVWYRNPLHVLEKQLGNPDFKDELDWAAKRIYRDRERQYTDLFSGNWVWRQSVGLNFFFFSSTTEQL